ncbi:MAG: recombinase family protein [Methylocystis sp.]
MVRLVFIDKQSHSICFDTSAPGPHGPIWTSICARHEDDIDGLAASIARLCDQRLGKSAKNYIFRQFADEQDSVGAANDSPETIARRPNREGVPGPGGRLWSNTTLRGQAERATDILNNSVYRGVLQWNRCSYVKEPRTGKRVARPNPPEKWETQAIPELQIVDSETGERVKERERAR